MEKGLAVPQEIKIELLSRNPAIPLPGIFLPKLKAGGSNKNLYVKIFVGALLTIGKRGNNLNHPPTSK